MINYPQWDGFEGRLWKEEINVRDFIQKNYRPYDGDESFLAGPTEATNKLWGALQALQKEERAKGGVLDMETEVVSDLTSYGPGYIDPELKDLEKIVGLQTDKPLKRAFMPFGGIKMAEQACTTYGYTPKPELHEIFTKYARTHNTAVFDAYTPEMKRARHSHIITGLPDTYGRGRIVGDYRRVALYGIDHLIAAKQEDFANCGDGTMTDEVIRQREELALQVRALNGMKEMAAAYGFDISAPAKNAREAVQWVYFGYLAAIKTQNGAAMSVGRISTFLDIYIQRDLDNGNADRAGSAGAHRPYGHEVPHGQVCAHPQLQPAVLRRPGVGHAGGGRHRHGRPFDGDKERLPLFAHAGKHGPRAGAQPDGAVFQRAAGNLQEIRRRRLHQDKQRPV